MDHGDYCQNEFEQAPIDALLAVLPDPRPFQIFDEDEHSEFFYFSNKLTIAVNAALPKLREISGNCPACIMAALRQKGIPVPMATDFDFTLEMEEIWSEINNNRNNDYD